MPGLTPMQQKDSTQLSIRPALVNCYVDAINKVFGTPIRVAKKNWFKFAVFEDDLREKGITAKEYSFTTIKMLEKWARDHHMSYLPIRIFLGDWALSKFMKLWNSVSVEMMPDEQINEESLLHSELLVARLYIEESRTKFVRLSTIVEDCKPMLSKLWYDLYISDNIRRIKLINKAIEILCEEYHITMAVNTYYDITRLL